MPLTEVTVALGTSAGSMLTAALVGVVMAIITSYGIRHHQAVFAWMKITRAKDDEARDLEEVCQYLRDLFAELCGLAQKPCRAADADRLLRLSNMIKGSIGQTEAISTELRTVVERIEVYLNTLIQEQSSRPTLAEHDALMRRAMKQEYARIELEHAIGAAQQKIRCLRRT